MKTLTKEELKEFNFNVLFRLAQGCDKALCLKLIMHTGLRATEALSIRGEDIDHANREITIRTAKRGKDRRIRYPQELNKHLTKADPFRFSYDTLLRHMKRMLPPSAQGKAVHALRHNFAIAHYDKHRDILKTMTVLGHKNIQNTMVYMGEVEGPESMDDVVSYG